MVEKTDATGKQKMLQALIAVVLWVLISGIGFWLIPQLLESSMLIYASFFSGTNPLYSRDYWGGAFLRSLLAVVFGACLVAIVIGSAEYYFKNLGKPGSWTAYARIIAVELSLIVLTAML